MADKVTKMDKALYAPVKKKSWGHVTLNPKWTLPVPTPTKQHFRSSSSIILHLMRWLPTHFMVQSFKVMFFLGLSVAMTSCSRASDKKSTLTIDGVPVSTLIEQDSDDSSAGAIIKFEEERFDFDTLVPDEIASHNFSFSNSGTRPLLIASVKSTCGCTVPSWSEEVIEPGEGGEITVTFDASGRSGPFIKTVQIRSNAKPPISSIRISGFIQPVDK
ncbi:MAG: DUF1573 domain-containing protein [Saprospiraceae bacterium]|nr:DUF1573 domain-containing protein [Saprospiraceae bacterium]